MGALIPAGLFIGIFILAKLVKTGKSKETIVVPPPIIEPKRGTPIVIKSSPKSEPAPDIANEIKKYPTVQTQLQRPTVVTTPTKPKTESTSFFEKAGEKLADEAAAQAHAPFEMLNHSLLPKQVHNPVRIASITTYDQAQDYARAGFHKVVDFSDQGGPKDLLAYAAMAYFQAASLKKGLPVKDYIAKLAEANKLTDKAVNKV